MNKEKSLLDQIITALIIYKFRWLLVLLIIVGAVMFFFISQDLNREPIENGYSGFFDNIKYDEWTNEIIPKDEIYSPTIKYKSIQTPDGSNVSENELENFIEEYRKIQDNYGFLTEERKNKVESLVNMLFKLMFKIDYSFEKTATNTSYTIHLKNFDANGIHYDDYEIGATSEFAHILKLLFKGIYREQNSLEPDYGK